MAEISPLSLSKNKMPRAELGREEEGGKEEHSAGAKKYQIIWPVEENSSPGQLAEQGDSPLTQP